MQIATNRQLFFVGLVTAALLATSASAETKKKVYFMAGTASHGYGAHEHNAGCMLLAKSLEETVDDVEVFVHRNGWPKDPKTFADADVLVMYCDGGGRHPANQHLDEIDALAKRGCGIVCIHYGVEVPKGESGDKFMEWIGGYFETHWSVNPHWTAQFKELPKHPITRGLKPFEINDEWYYHMRFRKDMEGVTPILTAIPPESTLSRPDGAHSGNPHVRKKAGQPQHVAWASERPNGGRGFGFTGGHYHWNWADDNFRRCMLNAIVWCAQLEVPEGGVGDERPTMKDLEVNQDEEPRKNFDREAIKKQFDLVGGLQPSQPSQHSKSNSPVAPVYKSPLVTPSTPGHAVEIVADIRGAKQLFLVANDGGNGFSCDWADWMEPRLIGPKGEKKLTDLKWKSAQTQFGEVRIGANANGSALRVAGSPVKYGIGAHANSMIAYDLPPGYERFVAHGGLDNGGTDQGTCGDNASVQFLVYTQAPSEAADAAPAASREPADAVAGLDVYEGLEAKLFASEPELLSLTNLDIDHRGRIWVCEVVNYRRHNGKRPEGDRILILEDTDHDGKVDKTKVYYQGRDIDSAMGICVLGNKVIVSSSPNVWIFTDEDGDDKPDKKELFFSKTGQPQHDHSAHSFLFGPDGKLYWNFGNTGKVVHDKDGKVIVDKMGNPVVDNGKPYYGGMPFRCDLDGSNFEVLAHNFRNNYEVTVDSFGNLWQSDNDDDGNRGVRINFVMEHGNYGYLEEGTGRGWREARTGMHAEIPLRHWHLNDPGVVPNLLQTGAGSPTGITMYEGRLLPKVFWDQMIHCDAGPNIVRSYPVKQDGAGYTATTVDLVHGARDNWFRPADVCVAPDGSVFITDWYDPGVGGHNMRDLERGRLFRVAPPGHSYRVTPPDFSTVAGAIAGLKSPNLSTRYMGWTALHGMGVKAESALRELLSDENPRIQARALWLLANIDGKAEAVAKMAAKSENPQLRIVGLRIARQRLPHAISLVNELVKDRSPAVRRECAIALRESKSDDVPRLWAELARQYDGKDRWYLEALGIAAESNWDACLDAYLAIQPDALTTTQGREIVWRSRAKRTPGLLTQLIKSTTEVSQAARLMRAFDFQTADAKQPALLELAFDSTSIPPQIRDFVSAEAVQRLKGVDILGNAKYAAGLDRMLNRVRGQQQFVDLVAAFKVKSRFPELLTLARDNPENSLGVAAITALLANQQQELLRSALRQPDPKAAARIATAMANASDGRAVGLLTPFVKDATADVELRRQATRGMARSKNGAEKLLAMVKANELDARLTDSAAAALSTSPLGEIRDQALKIFPPPPSKNNKPIPPIRDLVKQQGDVKRGAKLFATTAQCANCHMVGKTGKEVGPSLTEIGKKLSREAMFESILYPSAGVSHNYENFILQLEDGTALNGLLVSKTDEQVVIKDEKAIVRTIPTKDIARMKKLDISLMPADLQKQMTIQDLLDVVEYLTTLKP